MYIILADAELELIPQVLKDDPKVEDFLRRNGKEDALLDSYLIGNAMERHFPGKSRRWGFPHISYIFFRLNEESILNDYVKLDYAIHTKHDVIIEREDLKEIGAGYTEFSESVERILIENRRRMSLIDYVKSKGILEKTVVLHPKGDKSLEMSDRLNYVIGGFPEGDFSSDISQLRKFSIYDKEMTVPETLEFLHFKLFHP